MSLLKKKNSELTKEEHAKLKKDMGVPGTPYPMVGTKEQELANGERELQRFLGVLEDDENPLEVYSERKYSEMLGLAYRDMPTPGMLSIFYEGLLRRRVDSTKRVQFVKGEPGAGKSYMGKMIAKMRSDEGAYYVDCGGKNLNDILYETVLDFSNDSRFYDDLDERLAAGDMSALSLKQIRVILGEAVTKKGDGYVVDWDKVGNAPSKLSDEEAEKWDRSKKLMEVSKILEKIGRKEGILTDSSNTLGLSSVEGPLIRAFKEGREIVLDEYNKSKEGTDDQLQTVLQFLTGEISECTVENKLKDKADESMQAFSFRREDTKVGFFVTMTGNDSEDGSTTRELNRSVYSRLRPRKIPQATEEDWQHRICQIMTGLPVSTLYRMTGKQNSEDFGALLKKLRVMGLSKDAVDNIPKHQMDMLNNWQNTLMATKKLAKFYHTWSQLTNPNSEIMQRAEMGMLALEVDEEYHNEVTIDFRIVIDHLQEALDIKADITPILESSGFDVAALGKEVKRKFDIGREDPSMRFGTRLVDIIINKVTESSADIGKKALHAQLTSLAENCGLVNIDLKEGVATKKYKVSDLLDINPYTDPRASVQAKLMQKLVAENIRQNYKDIKAGDEEIVTLSKVLAELDKFKATEIVKSVRSNRLFVINTDKKTMRKNPFIEISTLDATPAANDGNARIEAKTEQLVEANALLASLALPSLGQQNMKALWNSALSNSGRTSSPDDEVVDDALAMAEGVSDSGLAITTVMTKRTINGRAEANPLHVVQNTRSGKTIIVGSPISSYQMSIFRRAGLIYIDRTDERAHLKAQSAIDGLVGGRSKREKDALRDAFLLRNTASNEKKMSKWNIGRLIVSEDVDVSLPHYVKMSKAGSKAKKSVARKKAIMPKPPAPVI